MAKVVWTEEARRWLQEIYDYIAEDNEEAAYRTVRAIHERAEILRFLINTVRDGDTAPITLLKNWNPELKP